MNKLKKDAKHFGEYSSSAMYNVNFAIGKQIYSSYSKNLHFMRGTFMMNMFISQQNSDFFDIPSAPSLFQSVYMKVSSMLNNYPAMFIQNLAAKIQKIYACPYDFAATVDLFFQEDITDVIIFAYSTFPSIYSFFLTDEFCSSASSFLKYVFKSSKNQLLSELLLSSFFISGTVFDDHFFSVIGDYLFERTYDRNEGHSNNDITDDKFSSKKNTNIFKLFNSRKRSNSKIKNDPKPKEQIDIDDFFPTFIRSLETCLPLLSPHHIEAFKNFCVTFPQASYRFFLQKILIQPFQTASESSISLVSSKGNQYFLSFLNALSELPPSDPHILTFLSVVIKIPPNRIIQLLSETRNSKHCIKTNIESVGNCNDNGNFDSINNDCNDNSNPKSVPKNSPKSNTNNANNNEETVNDIIIRSADLTNSSSIESFDKDDQGEQLEYIDIYPSLKKFVWTHGVPLLFSHIDIKLLVDILKFTSLFDFKVANNFKFNSTLRDSFDTVTFNVFPLFCGTNPPEQGIGLELFGEMPPSLEKVTEIYKDCLVEPIDPSTLEDDDESNDDDDNDDNDGKEKKQKQREIEIKAGINSEKKRIFRNLIKIANDENISLEEIILNPPKKFALLENDPSYIFLLLNKFHENFVSIERSILMEEAKKQMEILIMSTSQMTNITYHHFSFSFLMNKIRNINDIVPAIHNLVNSNSKVDSVASSDLLLTKSKVNSAFLSQDDFIFHRTSENCLPTKVMFEISMTALDTLKLCEGTKKIEMMEADFEDELMMWIEDEWPEYKENEIFQKRLKNIESLAKFLKHVQKGGYGRRIKIIINFVQNLKLILTSENNHLWKPALKYAVFFSSQKQIFSTFLYIHHFLITKLRLDDIWENEVRNLFSMFSAGMWSILDKNADLGVKYSDFNKVRSIFYP